MSKEITDYDAAWNLAENAGSIKLQLGGKWKDGFVPFDNTAEFRSILMLLQGQKKVYLYRNKKGHDVFTTKKP